MRGQDKRKKHLFRKGCVPHNKGKTLELSSEGKTEPGKFVRLPQDLYDRVVGNSPGVSRELNMHPNSMRLLRPSAARKTIVEESAETSDLRYIDIYFKKMH